MKILCAALVAALLPVPALATTNTQPTAQRHLVYAFTYGVSTDKQIHSSGMGATMSQSGGNASGMTDYTGGSSDKGTIVADVVSEQPDSGLVIVVSEQGQ